jgi:hypothetical protein
MAWAMRPWRPITFPRSPLWTRNSNTVTCSPHNISCYQASAVRVGLFPGRATFPSPSNEIPVALIESAQKELVNIGCLPRFETKESHNKAAETDDSRWH